MQKKTIWDMRRPTVEQYRRADKAPVCVVADNVRSLNNIGSLLRTCDAMAVRAVHLCGISDVPAASPEVHKTALGAEYSVDWRHHASTPECVQALKADGWRLLCLEQVKGSTPLHRFVPRQGEKYALVVGNEVDGVDPLVVDACDLWLEIPQRGTKHSLNVTVSAAMALWQLCQPR